jgi:hypothetical protein
MEPVLDDFNNENEATDSLIPTKNRKRADGVETTVSIPQFLDMEPVLDNENEATDTMTDQEPQTDTDRTTGGV